MINNEKWRKSSIRRKSEIMIFNIKWNESNEIKNIINDCSKTSWIMQQIWEMNLIKKWKRQKNANVNKNSHCRINQKSYLMNFIFVFVFIFKWTFNALFSNDRNHQIIHERFRFIFIFNRCNDINFIFRFNVFSFHFLRNFNRDVNFLFEKFILNFDTLYFENIKQFFIFNFSEIESSFRYFYFLLKLN